MHTGKHKKLMVLKFTGYLIQWSLIYTLFCSVQIEKVGQTNYKLTIIIYNILPGHEIVIL